MADPTPPSSTPAPWSPAAAAAALPRRAAEVADRLDGAAAAYLATVRAAVGQMIARDPADGDVQGAIAEVRARASIDTDVPTASRRPAARYVKGGVKVAGGWYLRYVASQVTAFAVAVAALGDALAARADALEARTASVESRLAGIEERVQRIERRLPPPDDAAGVAAP